jgi:hypothetical protein
VDSVRSDPIERVHGSRAGHLVFDLEQTGTRIFVIGGVHGVDLRPAAGRRTGGRVCGVGMLADNGCHQIKQAYRWAAVLAIAGLAAAAYFRPDPLAPVPYVERVFQLAFAGGPASLFAVLVCAASLSIPFATDAPAERKTLAFAFLAYFICCFAVNQLGNFPVPVLGAGAGPVLGWFLALVFLPESARNFQSTASSGSAVRDRGNYGHRERVHSSDYQANETAETRSLSREP